MGTPTLRVGWRSTLALIAAVTLARLVYLAWLCPYTLIEDEAHYWEWSRRLAASYYTKGPGVAWLIAASTRVFGDTEFGVRFPAALCSAAAALSIGLLTRATIRDARAPFIAVAAFFLAPAFQALGLMITIDAPLVACWAAAAWGAWKAMGERRWWGWMVLGAALGAGTLCKYTMLLAAPGMVWWWFARAGAGERAGRAWRVGGAIVGVALFALALAPMIAWNADNGWPTVRHLLGHLGVAGGDTLVVQGDGGWRYDPNWTLGFLATQLGLLGPLAGLMALGAWRAWRERGDDRRPASFLLALALPTLVFYVLVSFVTEPEGNWALAGYITLVPLAAREVCAALTALNEPRASVSGAEGTPTRSRSGLVAARRLWIATIIVGAVLVVATARLDWWAAAPGLGRYVPVHRFTGADRMAAHAAKLGRGLEAVTGQRPFFAAAHYGRSSQLAFYLPGQPRVYCISRLTGGRPTQYDYWADTDLNDPALVGRPAVVVGALDPAWAELFEEVREVGRLDGDGKKNRPAWVCVGFKGLPNQAR